MAYIDHLRVARDRYAEELALRTAPPVETRWDERLSWLREEIERINAILERADELGEEHVDGAVWTIRQAMTGMT
jgi:uncharacterized small protein (DUF1192 family)